MAAVALVAILEAAAEAYGKQLAITVGEGVVETLFNQGRIAADLDAIQKQLAALSEFIRVKLPVLIEHSVDQAFARKAEYDVASKALTVVGSIATLQRALRDQAPEANIQFLVSELCGHADDILEVGGTLISYGQPYYASVSVAFGVYVKAYSLAVRVSPERFEALSSVATVWRQKLLPWVDAGRPTSLQATLNYWEARHALGATCVPSFETWSTHTTREVCISWQHVDFGEYGGGSGIMLAGAWFGYFQDGRGLQGDTLGRFVSGLSFEEAQAQGKLQYTIPEWWAVKADVPASVADYNQVADLLAALCRDYFAYPEISLALKNAVDVVGGILKVISTILSQTEGAAFGGKPNSAPAVLTAAQQFDRVNAVLRMNRPGIGLTRTF